MDGMKVDEMAENLVENWVDVKDASWVVGSVVAMVYSKADVLVVE